MITTFSEAKSEFYALVYKKWVAEASDREVGEDIIELARAVHDNTEYGFDGEVKAAWEVSHAGSPIVVQKLLFMVGLALQGADVLSLGAAVPAPIFEGEMAQEWLDYKVRVDAEGEVDDFEIDLSGLPEELSKLIVAACACHHGEIFMECYGGNDVVEWTNGVLTDQIEMRDEMYEPGEDGWKEIPASVCNVSEAMAWWVDYFEGYPSHGEYAGTLVGCLVGDGHHDAAIKILTICGKEGFGWDS